MGKLIFGFRVMISFLAVILLFWLFFGNLGDLVLGLFRFGYSEVYIPQADGAFYDAESGFFKVMIVKENNANVDGVEFLFYDDEGGGGYESFFWSGEIKEGKNALYFDVGNCRDKLSETLAISLLDGSVKGIATRKTKVHQKSFEKPNFYYDLCNPCEFGGDGSQNDPTIICNCDELENISFNLRAHYAFGNNINCAGREFDVIGDDINPFRGSIDGRGYSVFNLTVNSEGVDYIGLVGVLYNGAIKNVGLVNSEFIGNLFVGSLVGRQEGGMIEKSFARDVKVRGLANVGGLVGNSNGEVWNSYVLGEVFGSIFAGGFIGGFSGSSINNYFVGNVEAIYKGFVGKEFVGSEIKNCYYNGDLLYNVNSVNAISKSEVDMKKKTTYRDWDFEEVWAIDEVESYPELK